MSYNTMSKAVRDQALVDRVNAAAQQEARNGPNADTAVAANLRRNLYGAADPFMWAVASDTEAAYASALAAENPNPGGDESVITDGMILSAVQAHWPDEPPAGTPT